MHPGMFSAVFVLEGFILLTLWLFLFQLMKQQGRILAALDSLQRQFTSAQIAAFTGQNTGSPGPAGLNPGAAAPPFTLPDLAGNMVALEDFKGRRVLLIHWSPGCGFCTKIAP